MSEYKSIATQAVPHVRPTNRGGGLSLPVFVPTAAVVLALVVYGIGAPSSLAAVASVSFDWVAKYFGWLMIVITNGCIVFCGYLVFSRYGKLRLGKSDDRPEFKTVSWIAMMFAAGLGIGLIFWGVAEPVSHYADPLPGLVEPRTQEAARAGIDYAIFHWGLHGWALFAVAGLAFGYFGYRHGRRFLVSEPLRPLFGDRVDGWIGHVVNSLALFATLFGVIPSAGLGAIQINSAMNRLWGVESSKTIALALIIGMMAVVIISAVTGVAKGVQFLANVALVASGLMILFMFVFGPTAFLANSVIESLQSYLTNLLPMSSRTGTYGQSDWIAAWTVYYWIWWISWIPFVGMFIARISKGRTVRELILGVTLVPTAVGGAWFAVFGGIGTYLDLNGIADIAEEVAADTSMALFAVFETLPFSTILTSIAMVLIALYFISGVDAATVVLGILSTGGSDKPPKWVVIFWGAATAAAASVLMLAGGLDAIQSTMAVVCAPFGLILICLAWSLLKQMRTDLPTPPKEVLLSAPLWNDTDTVRHDATAVDGTSASIPPIGEEPSHSASAPSASSREA